ncbi:HK97-gp10 family putative phage morphogenesis protein [Sinorhizobium meliloti]|uniref:HK97-gp10 family putative phage morphogenesis protein n=1 Tax=Rhizobium meliloti TaxID=382 RepID=UPI000FDCB37F|nr:HK97-gp10 family putative phage morphogenesis protein [Sinorhizobium meliloti]RVQ23048.1 HK97 gp10 family phage protein [Sinorhizobium meliloti]
MAGVRVSIEGLKQLDQALAELPKATGKAVLRRTLIKAGEPLADDMRAKAPDDPATGGNDLRSSIGVGTKLSKRQAKLHRKEFKNDKASAEVFVGAGPVPHAHLQEFGTSRHGPQPFARLAWDAGKNQVLDTIKDELAVQITKAAQRLARKAARLAAKG